MYRADPQNTGRTNFIGPTLTGIEWENDSLNVTTGVTIGFDSTIYVGVSLNYTLSNNFSGLLALNKSGKRKWLFDFKIKGHSPSTPLIGNNGTIYISSPALDGRMFYAINSDGSIKWSLNIDYIISQDGINIGKDGKIFAIGYQYQNGSWALLCISPIAKFCGLCLMKTFGERNLIV